MQNKSKPNNYTELTAVDEAGTQRERTCEYPRRSHGRKKNAVVTTNHEKSAEVIVPWKKNVGRTEQSLVRITKEGGQCNECRIP